MLVIDSTLDIQLRTSWSAGNETYQFDTFYESAYIKGLIYINYKSIIESYLRVSYTTELYKKHIFKRHLEKEYNAYIKTKRTNKSN